MPKAAPRHWTDYLPEAGNRLAIAKETYGEIGARCEDAPALPADPPAIDLQDPQIVAAINAAVSREQAAATERESGLRTNRDAILEEKRAWAAFGSPDALQEKLSRLDELESDAEANKQGLDPDKFKAAVEQAAQAKYLSRAQELSGVMDTKDTLIGEQKTTIEQLGVANHRAFVAENLLRAAMPDDARLIQPGAEAHFIDTLAPFIVEHKVEGLPHPVARLRVNGALVPGSGPDQLMDLSELLPLARQGKGPLPMSLSFCFVSGAKGSGITSPPKQTVAGTNWWKMSDSAQDAFIRENGAAAANALIDSSGLKPTAQ